MNEYCVYAHYLKGDEQPFYIGKGKGDRPFSKIRTALWKMHVKDKEYTVDILKNNLEEYEALLFELELIEKHGCLVDGTGSLVNVARTKKLRKTEWIPLHRLRRLIKSDPTAAEVLILLSEMVDDNAQALCSYEHMTTQTGYSRRTLARAIKTLKEKQIIQIVRKTGTFNVYKVIIARWPKSIYEIANQT